MESMNLPEEGKEMARVSKGMQAISHPLRLKIIDAVGAQEKMVTHIMKEVGSSQSNISQHVEVLRKVGILQSRRERNRIYCSVSDQQVLQILSSAKECFCGDNQTPETLSLH